MNKELPSLWLRRVDVDDLIACGDGCEADVHCAYSPNSFIITHMDKYVPAAQLEAEKAKVERVEAKAIKQWSDAVCELTALTAERDALKQEVAGGSWAFVRQIEQLKEEKDAALAVIRKANTSIIETQSWERAFDLLNSYLCYLPPPQGEEEDDEGEGEEDEPNLLDLNDRAVYGSQAMRVEWDKE